MQKQPVRDEPGLDHLSVINADGSRKHPEPADVKGRFVTWRRVVYAALIAIYVVLPFVQIGGHPAIHLSIAERKFYLFGATYNAQDAWILVFLFTTAGFALMFVTTWLGRVWCGWACPQTVFLEGVYRVIERWIDGPRERRIKLANGPWTFEKVWKRGLKQAAFLAVSFALAHVFLAFFVSIEELWHMMRSDPREHWEPFVWVMAITGLLHFNFSWFREQLCIVICPYGRLQSVLTDRHSLVIGYDASRGEPRGKRVKAKEGVALPQLGHCVDCKRCVVVCPTGIDIRNGLQLECIGCAQCIDACDEVMDKLHFPRGLVRYDSLEGLGGREKKVLRPRLFVYVTLLTIAVTGLSWNVFGRTPFEANLLRVRGAPYLLEAGTIRNQYELHLVNKNPGDTVFKVTPTAAVKAGFVVPQTEVKLGSLQSYRLPIFVTVDDKLFSGPFEVEVDVVDSTSGKQKHVKAKFLGPTVRPGA